MTGENVIIDPLIKQLMESAATGEAAKLFLQSGLGRHIAQRAADEVEEALALLVDVPPTDSVRIADLQAQVKVARQSIIYLTEAIAEGDNALRQLHDDES